jgi:hypothetical protein
MSPVPYFNVRVWQPDEHPQLRRYDTRTTSDIMAEVTSDRGSLALDVDLVQEMGEGITKHTVSWGNMLVFLSADGHAWVRLLEHCDHIPKDPDRAGQVGEVTGFVSEPGERFAVPASDVISREQAARILAYWLDCEGKNPEFTWS